MEGEPKNNESYSEDENALPESLDVVAARNAVETPPEAPDTSELLERMKEKSATSPSIAGSKGVSSGSHTSPVSHYSGHHHDGFVVRNFKRFRGLFWLLGTWMFGGIKQSLGAKSEGGGKKNAGGGHSGGHH
jgi:hypothetical protein